MEIYRICLEKWAHSLAPSGRAGRWNADRVPVLYTAASRSLACLENLVHRSGEGANSNFRIMVIEVPDDITISQIHLKDLPKGWNRVAAYPVCRALGEQWINQGKSCLLSVPSSIIPQEKNILLNSLHPEFNRIKLKGVEPFFFDERLRGLD